MSKPTHVLPNSIMNARAALHPRRNGSAVTTLFPVWRQGQGQKKDKEDVVSGKNVMKLPKVPGRQEGIYRRARGATAPSAVELCHTSQNITQMLCSYNQTYEN